MKELKATVCGVGINDSDYVVEKRCDIVEGSSPPIKGDSIEWENRFVVIVKVSHH